MTETSNIRICFFVFIDCQKAFENVRHAELSKMLLNTNIDKDKWSVRPAHCDQFTPVRLSEGKTNWFHVKGGVLQGCALSPDLFNLCSEMILNDRPKGMVNNGIKINIFRYADDTVLFVSPRSKSSRSSPMQLSPPANILDVNSKKTRIKSWFYIKDPILISIFFSHIFSASHV